MEKVIFLPNKEKKKLEVDFKVCRVTVWQALNYRCNSRRAKKLRAAAIARGGVIYGGKTAPNEYMPECDSCEIFDRAYIQTFGNRIELGIDWSDGLVVLSIDGEEVQSWDNPLLSELANIQLNASELSKSLNSQKVRVTIPDS